MPEAFLLSRLLLRFENHVEDLIEDISAIAVTPDGSLWVGSDELLGLERLARVEPHIYADHQRFLLADFIDLFNTEDEIDIEGLDYSHHYLWFVGSHSTKRGKVKKKKVEKNLENLAEIKTETNRYLLARIPVINGELVKSCALSERPRDRLSAACLQKTDNSNILIEALANDPHLKPYISSSIPSKENGLDIEGITVYENKVFLGLRGPVLRGWAIILELEVAETEPGILTLTETGEAGILYKKHFLDLNGMGVRELCLFGEDLLILAGPTMDLEGAMRIFRLKNALTRPGHTINPQEKGELEVLFDLPFIFGSDHAEGLALMPCLGQPRSLLVAYDAPDPRRKPNSKQVFVDVFRLD